MLRLCDSDEGTLAQVTAPVASQTPMSAAATWKQRWHEISVRADQMKDSPSAIPALFDAYRSLDPRDTDAVDAVIAAAVESHDETERFDALALVREFKIVAAIPGLRRLASRLQATASPGAPFELAKVMEILGELEQAGVE
jgi:hypothetical protein